MDSFSTDCGDLEVSVLGLDASVVIAKIAIDKKSKKIIGTRLAIDPQSEGATLGAHSVMLKWSF